LSVYITKKIRSRKQSYLALQIARVNAQAIKGTDKLIFTRDSVFPSLIFNNGAKVLTLRNNIIDQGD
jgi:hypothetical protein